MKSRKLLFVAAIILLVGLPGLVGTTHAQEQQISKSERRELFRRGAKIWPMVCGGCHNDRPVSEFSPEQWTLIMRHMQTRSLLPASDSKAVLIYLQSAHEPQ
jgi:hypothetical protein